MVLTGMVREMVGGMVRGMTVFHNQKAAALLFGLINTNDVRNGKYEVGNCATPSATFLGFM